RSWVKMGEKTAYGKWNIVGKPRLHDAVAEQRASGFASGRRHVRQQNRASGTLPRKTLDERRNRARFADRHRMDPQHVIADGACGARVASEALADARAVLRLV